MRIGTLSFTLILAGGMLVIAAGAALADPPGRVGRLSYTEGVVSFHAGDQDQWSPATLNYPVAAGESFWTEPGARAEIEVGSSEIRLDETTLLDVVALDDATTRLQLDQGALNIHLRSLPPGGVQVQTPRAQVNLVQPGTYHIDAGHPDGNGPPAPTAMTVLEGQATTPGPRSAIDVQPGETATVAGEPASVTLSEGNSTPFDDWALTRERREAAVEATRYVSPEATGYRDLDNYGRWTNNPSYGAVWYPTAVDTGWAPYRYGHWAYVAPWGWTWIDDAPWGFAPFHYGRWVEIDGAWGWVPGAVVARPVYAPALVAFVGGAGFGVTISAGATLAAVGWVPLAPFEVYRPYYPTSVAYVRNVNVTNVNRTVINNITNVTVNKTVVVNNFANQRAATVVPAAAFTQAASVQKATVTIPHEQLAQARVAPTVAHLQPTPAARAGIAQPAVATAVVPHANAPASIAPQPVPVQPPAASHAAAVAPAVPKAPGPSVRATAAPSNQPARTVAAPASVPPAAGAAPTRPTPPHPAPPVQATTPHPPTQAAAPQPPKPPATQAPSPPTTAARAPVAPPAPPNTGPSAGSAPGQARSQASAPAAPAPTATPGASQHGAPGPATAHGQTAPAPPKPPASSVPPPAQPKPSAAQIQRPPQQTQLAPTASGWVRAPAPPPPQQQHPAAAQAHEVPPKAGDHPQNAPAHPGKDERKPNNQ